MDKVTLNDMHWGVKKGDVSDFHCYMNIITAYKANNQNYIYFTKKSD